MPYTIPEALHAEIDELEALIQRFRSGDLDPVTMKAKRVPFGVYEQRTPGTYMTRIRCTGGTITPSQFARVAELAAEYGSPFVHLTTRQDIQIHDVDLGRVPSLSRELAAIGLSSRGGGGNTVRNILASEDAGQNLSELFDVGPWVDALTDRVIREGDSWNLPRKFKISFAANDADSSLAGFNDLGFFPRLGPDGEPGFKVYVAGGLGGKPRTALPFEEFVPAVEVHLVVTAIKKFFDKNGNRKNKRAARLRFLRDKFGDEGLLAKLREAVAQERASGWEPLVPKVREVGTVAAPATPVAPLAGFEAWKGRHVTAAKREGFFNVRVPVLLGDLPSDKAVALGRGLEGFGLDVLRLGIRQNLSIVGVAEARLPELHVILSDAGLAQDPGLVGSLVACTGADTCKLGMCLPKGAVRELAERLPKSGLDLPALEGVRVHISGCPNTCAQHMAVDLGYYGIARRQGDHSYPAYRVVAGGIVGEGKARLAREITQVSAWKMPDFTVSALEAFQKEAAGRSFVAWLDAEGEKRLVEIAESLSDVPLWEESQAPYIDWSATEPFSPAKGGAECSAGLFDLIDVDRKVIAGLREELVLDPDHLPYLYDLLLAVSRVLLITRGLEPVGDRAVFEGFAEQFLKTGLLPARFASLVLRGKELGASGLAGRTKEILELSDLVEELYQGMDDSLRFPELAAITA